MPSEQPTATVAQAAEPEAPASLWQNRNFRLLWASQSISLTGSAVSYVALPIIAVIFLKATPQQMGFLIAAETAPALLLRLPAAAWADGRRNRIPVIAACSLINGLLVGMIPLLWLLNVLNFWLLLGLALGISGVGSVGGVFASPVVPEIVQKEQLVEANGKLSATRGMGEVAGRSVAGLLINLFSAPLVVLLDAASFFIASLLTRNVHVPEERRRPARGAMSLQGLLSGITPLFAQPFLRASVVAMAYLSLANGVVSALLVLYMVEVAGLPATLVGPIIGAGSIGGILGGVSVNAIHRLLGIERTVAVSIVLLTGSFALLPFAQSGIFGAIACVNYEFVGSFGAALLVISVFSEVPGRVPPPTIARAMAVVSLVPEGSAMVGALIGGALGSKLGLHYTFGASLAFALVANGLLVLVLGLGRGAKRLKNNSPAQQD